MLDATSPKSELPRPLSPVKLCDLLYWLYKASYDSNRGMSAQSVVFVADSKRGKESKACVEIKLKRVENGALITGYSSRASNLVVHKGFLQVLR